MSGDELVNMEAAIGEFEQTRSKEACERICIWRRAACATFVEWPCWTQAVDESSRDRLRRFSGVRWE